MGVLTTAFLLRTLITVVYALQGTMRIRLVLEQRSIWMIGYRYPVEGWMPLFGATQVAAALLSALIPVFGLPIAAAVATIEIFNHSVRQGAPPAAIFDVAVLGIAVFSSVVYDACPLLWVAIGAAAGATAFWGYLQRRFPVPAAVSQERRLQ